MCGYYTNLVANVGGKYFALCLEEADKCGEHLTNALILYIPSLLQPLQLKQ